MDRPVIITATYSGDRDLFKILRKAIEKFMPEYHHHVLINTEDLSLFRELTADSKNLSLIKSAELLPKKIEWIRRSMPSWHFSVMKRVAWRYGMDAAVYRGWKIQQLLKLNYLPQIPSESAIFLDSDIYPVREIITKDIFSGDKLLYLESNATNLEDVLFDSTTHLFFKQPMTSRPTYYNYIHPAPRFLKRTGQTFIKLANKNHAKWEEALCRLEFPSEYDILGYCMRDIEEYDGYQQHPLPISDLSYSIQFHEDVAHLRGTIKKCMNEQGNRGFLLVQSNLNIPMQEWAPSISEYIERFDTMQQNCSH